MKNVYPDMKPPIPKSEREKKRKALKEKQAKYSSFNFARKLPEILNKFQIQLPELTLCIESELEATSKGAKLFLQKCSKVKRQVRLPKLCFLKIF